jgi:hypothetical protein
MSRRHAELELFFWTIRLTILLVLPLHVTDVGIYMNDVARLLVQGEWPYRDFAFEYPPLTFLFFLLPSLALKLLHLVREWDYRLFFAFLLLPFDYLLFRSFRRNPPIPSAAFLYVSFTAILSQLLFDRIDLLVGFGIAYPFLLARREAAEDARFAIGWGFASGLKLVPLLLVPFRVLEKWESLDRAGRLMLFTSLPLFFSTLAVLGLSGGKISFLSYHSLRGVQVESLLGNLYLSLQSLGWVSGIGIETSFRSQQVSGVPGLVAAAKFLFWAMLLTVYGTLLFAVRRRGFSALRASWLFLLTFITFGYVLSPQFFFWLIPLAPLAAAELKGRARGGFLLGFFLVLLMTGVHFSDYWKYAAAERLNLLFLTARNAVLLAFWVACWIWFRARPNEKPESAGL